MGTSGSDRRDERSRRLGPSGAVLYHALPVLPQQQRGLPGTTLAFASRSRRAHEGGTLSDGSIGGRALVTRRAVIDIVRRVTLGSYGVAGFDGNWADRLLGWIEQRPGGLRVSVAGGSLGIRLHLRVAHGLPIAEVARQVDLAVRHAIRTALGREVDRLSIRVAQLEIHPGGEPPQPRDRTDVGPSDLADSGTDVA